MNLNLPKIGSVIGLGLFLISGALWAAVESMPVPLAVAPLGAQAQSLMIAPSKKPDMAPLHSYTYVFQGKAMLDGRPYAHAQVRLEAVSMQSDQIKQVETDAEGNYRVEITVSGRPNEPLNWTLHALTSDFKQSELTGSQHPSGRSDGDAGEDAEFRRNLNGSHPFEGPFANRRFPPLGRGEICGPR